VCVIVQFERTIPTDARNRSSNRSHLVRLKKDMFQGLWHPAWPENGGPGQLEPISKPEGRTMTFVGSDSLFVHGYLRNSAVDRLSRLDTPMTPMKVCAAACRAESESVRRYCKGNSLGAVVLVRGFQPPCPRKRAAISNPIKRRSPSMHLSTRGQTPFPADIIAFPMGDGGRSSLCDTQHSHRHQFGSVVVAVPRSASHPGTVTIDRHLSIALGASQRRRTVRPSHLVAERSSRPLAHRKSGPARERRPDSTHYG
jgi:hypothetical protein